jgi:hypothetical protein
MLKFAAGPCFSAVRYHYPAITHDEHWHWVPERGQRSRQLHEEPDMAESPTAPGVRNRLLLTLSPDTLSGL